MRSSMIKNAGRIFAFLCVWSIIPSAHGSIAELALQSQPGDPIGGGGTFDIFYSTTASPASTINPQNRRTLPSGQVSELVFVVNKHIATDTLATLFFGTNALGIALQPGIYENAELADIASPGHPGLDVSFQHLACNTITGSFTITDATFNSSNVIQSFAASFEQHCDGAVPALFGTFTYNVAPEPAACSLFAAAALILINKRRKRTDFQ